jgi:hypothetical protein
LRCIPQRACIKGDNRRDRRRLTSTAQGPDRCACWAANRVHTSFDTPSTDDALPLIRRVTILESKERAWLGGGRCALWEGRGSLKVARRPGEADREGGIVLDPCTFWCDDCHEMTTWIPPSEVARLTRKSTKTIYEWIEEGKVHARRLPSNHWLVCWCSVCGERTRNPSSVGCSKQLCTSLHETGSSILKAEVSRGSAN